MTALETPPIPRITHADAEEVARAADAQLLDLLDRLEPEHWSVPTDCADWDVAAIVGHLIGAAKGNASTRELLRQLRWGARHAAEHDGNKLDATNALQVADHADLTPAQRITELRSVLPVATARRTGANALKRRLPVPLGLESGSAMPGLPARIAMGTLLEVVYTRDTWLHTVDIERATGVVADRTGDLDRVVVADAVADWLATHGQPVQLQLAGRAGGRFEQGSGGPRLELDAIEWARTVSGRVQGSGLLATPVLF